MLTQEELKRELLYNPDTGEFTRLTSRGRGKAGAVAGTRNSEGYIHICVGCKLYKAHRLAVLYITGEWPPQQIDHINGIRHDNRWCNLRPANQTQQNWNSGLRSDNLSGTRGVTRSGRRWRARAVVDGRERSFGVYDTIEEAHEVWRRNVTDLRGDWLRENNG